MAAKDRRSSIAVKVEYGTYTEAEGKKTFVVATGDSKGVLNNVSDIPDLGGAPEQIDVTAIGDLRRKFINGIIEQDELEFTCFYEQGLWGELKKLEEDSDPKHAVKISIYGSNADKEANKDVELEVIVFGTITVSLAGFGVGDAINYTMRVAVEDIEFGPEAA